MKLIDKGMSKILEADEGYSLKDKNDNGETLEDGSFIEPYLTKTIYLGKQITTLEEAKEIYEEVEE